MCEDDSVECDSDIPPLPAAIDDLFEVKKFLMKLFDWQTLGLALGLNYFTLKTIENNKRGNAGECMTEMLAAWLQHKYNVTLKGLPSWSVLQAALRNIGENELADKIIS